MTVGQLKELLSEYTDSTEVILLVDGGVCTIDGVESFDGGTTAAIVSS